MRAKSRGVWEQIPKHTKFRSIAQATKPLCLLLLLELGVIGPIPGRSALLSPPAGNQVFTDTLGNRSKAAELELFAEL